MTNSRFVVSTPPHIRQGRTISKMMLATIGALAPGAIFGIYQFGLQAAVLLFAGIGTAVATEAVVCKLAKRPIHIDDFHGVLVGLMLAMMVPSGCPWWAVVVGAFCAILLGKLPFGPLGGSPLSPAIIGLLVIMLSWPDQVTEFSFPSSSPAANGEEAVAESSLQAIVIDVSDVLDYSKLDMFTGQNQVGSLGSTSPLLLLLGGLFLLLSGNIRWHAPTGFLLGLMGAGVVSHVIEPSNPDPFFHLLSGLSIFGAFFLATENPTTPVTPWGMFLFGLFAGALTIVFRMTGMGFGSTAYGIIIMSLATPLFDRITPKPFGGRVTDHA